jgi:FMN reductase
MVEVSAPPDPDLVARIEAADAVILASPTYRAEVSWPLKALIDHVPRDRIGDGFASPLLGKATALVMTGASDHHFLGGDKVRSVLSGFFGAQVLSPGLYFSHAAFDDDHGLRDSFAVRSRSHGRALVGLASVIRSDADLSAQQPLV